MNPIIDKENSATRSVSRRLIVFVLPLLLANLFQSFYSIVGTLVVDRTVGKTGLTAISNASMISFIVNSTCIGVTMRRAVLIAQFKSADDMKGQNETVGILLSLTLTVLGIITAAALLGYKPLFGLLSTSSDAMGNTCECMEVICRGAVFVFGYNGVRSIMKGSGDSKGPLYFVGIAAIVNIVLDLLLAGLFGMGAKGAARVTIFSQGISFAVAIIHLKHRNFIFDFRLEHFVAKKDRLAMTLRMGLSTAVQIVVANISCPLITGILNQFEVAVTTASGVGLEINAFAGISCRAMGQVATTMVGQNIGASNRERVREAASTGLCLNLAITAVTVLFVQVFAGPIIRLFDPVSPEIARDGIPYPRIYCGFNSLIYGAMYTFDFFTTGVGSTNVAMANALLDAMAVRLPVSWLLAFSLSFGFPGIYLGQALFPILPAVAGGLYFKSRIWERGNLIRR